MSDLTKASQNKTKPVNKKKVFQRVVVIILAVSMCTPAITLVMSLISWLAH